MGSVPSSGIKLDIQSTHTHKNKDIFKKSTEKMKRIVTLFTFGSNPFSDR